MPMARVIVFESILIISSVFVFRSVWLWLDRCPWLGTDMGLLISFTIGMCGTVWALPKVHQCIKKD